MKLQVVRTQFGKDATNGLLFIDGVFECYTLEDQYQAVKVMHETCIPEGTYDIKFRKTGGFHAKYSARYKNAHYGMLHLQDVPGFTYILIHTGNTDEHTSGCLIVGETQQDLDINFNGMVGSSAVAYKKMYAKVANQLLQGKKVTIEYSKIDLDGKELSNSASPDLIKPDSVYEKLQEISGEIQVLSAKLDGKDIV
jgi:hypothetical protein|tara:strand:+ start:40 stop:627 length:588 start_codon:yes stop_codon:yes gene_type:complete